jgi:putative modified peptide
MAQHLADKRITINATPLEVLEFLQKLATDDAFRARFQKDPGEVLAEHHLYFPVGHLPADAVLPDKAALARALSEFTTSGKFDAIGVHSPDRWAFGLFWWLYYTNARPAAPCPRPNDPALAAAPPMSDEVHAALLARLGKLRIGASLTPREVFNFLLRLASDDEFRARLHKHPHQTLAEHHIYVPAHDPPVHIRLPAKHELQQVLMDVMMRQETALAFHPFNLNAELSWFVSFMTFLSVRGEPKSAR